MVMESNDELPEGWYSKPLEELCKTKPQSGGTPLSTVSEYYENGTIPWAITDDLTKSSVYLKNTRKKITKLGLDNSSARWFPKGTILFAMYGSIGRMAIADIRLTTNQAILGIIPDESQIDLKFLYYYLEHAKSRLIEKGRGGTQANVNAKLVKEFPVAYPELSIQRKIIVKLDAFFAEYNAAKKQHELTKARTEKIMQATIGKLIDADNCLSPIRNFSDIISGNYFKPEEFEKEGMRLVKINNIGYGSLLWDEVDFLDSKSAIAYPNLVLKAGDIVLALNRPITNNKVKVGRLIKQDCPAILYQRVGRFDIHSKEIDQEYLFYVLQSNYFRNELSLHLSGSDQPYIRTTILEKIEIPVPSFSEQLEIVKKVREIRTSNLALQQAVVDIRNKIERLPNSIFAKAFSGELVS